MRPKLERKMLTTDDQTGIPPNLWRKHNRPITNETNDTQLPPWGCGLIPIHPYVPRIVYY